MRLRNLDPGDMIEFCTGMHWIVLDVGRPSKRAGWQSITIKFLAIHDDRIWVSSATREDKIWLGDAWSDNDRVYRKGKMIWQRNE